MGQVVVTGSGKGDERCSHRSCEGPASREGHSGRNWSKAFSLILKAETAYSLAEVLAFHLEFCDHVTLCIREDKVRHFENRQMSSAYPDQVVCDQLRDVLVPHVLIGESTFDEIHVRPEGSLVGV